MRKKPVLLKVFVVFFLLVSAFMFSGAEAAFCKDTVQTVPAHQCFNCQSGHSVAIPDQSISVVPIFPKTLFDLEEIFFYPQVPSIDFFHPPIFA